MSDRRSHGGDNGGRCEGCDDPATIYQPQTTYPVMLGGGIGTGTMWLCPKCKAQRDALRRAEPPRTDLSEGDPMASTPDVIVHGATEGPPASIQTRPVPRDRAVSFNEYQREGKQLASWLRRWLPSGTYHALLREIAPEVAEHVKRSP